MVTTYDLVGIRAPRVNVEVTLDPTGAASMTFDGGSLSDAAQRELRVRVKSAIVNSGFVFPRGAVRVVVDVPNRQSGRLTPDLAVAVGILHASGQVAVAPGVAFLGEMGLDGGLRSVAGALCVARAAGCDGVTRLYVPTANAAEASLAGEVVIVSVASLVELVDVLQGTVPTPAVELPGAVPGTDLDLADIRGQEHAKRALEIAAAGGHSILFVGPPGSGKTMLARRLTTLLPPMTDQEAIEVAEVYSSAGLFTGGILGGIRTFRAPHHTASDPAITGGGSVPRPGEVALAHNGVLFLDDLPDFNRSTLARIGRILHDGVAVVPSVRHGDVGFPARFQLVGSMSPCPCGHLGDPYRVCTCTAAQIERDRVRVAPFIEDAFDLTVEVPPVSVATLRGKGTGESSAKVRERVVAARKNQRGLNAELEAKDLAAVAPLGASETAFLEKVVERLGLSAQAYHRIVKVARTVADLDGEYRVRVEHIAEAVQYRALQRARVE